MLKIPPTLILVLLLLNFRVNALLLAPEASKDSQDGIGGPENSSMQQRAADPDLVDGKTYKFDVQVNCACGGGEGSRPDPYLIIYQCKNGQAIKLATTSRKDNIYTALFRDAFQLVYSAMTTQMVYIDLWDDDTNPDDLLADTKCFDPFKTTTVKAPIHSQPEIEQCGAASSTGCAAKNTFNILVSRTT